MYIVRKNVGGMRERQRRRICIISEKVRSITQCMRCERKYTARENVRGTGERIWCGRPRMSFENTAVTTECKNCTEPFSVLRKEAAGYNELFIPAYKQN
jgi:hypothetical protein